MIPSEAKSARVSEGPLGMWSALVLTIAGSLACGAPTTNPPIAIWGNDGKETKVEPLEGLESAVRYTPPRATPGQPWNVMLVRPAAIEAGAIYRVVLEVRAVEKRPAILSVDQRKAPYANHDFQRKIDLQPQWQTLVFAFRPNVNDPECNLSLRISESAIPVELRRLVLEPYSNPETGWMIDGKGYLEARVTIADTKPQVVRIQPEPADAAARTAEIIVKSPPIHFTAGERYQIRFVSRTRWPTFVVCEGQILEESKPFGLRQTFQAQKNWSNHHLPFRATETGMGRICFSVRDVQDPIDIAKITLESNEWQLTTAESARAVLECRVSSPMTLSIKIDKAGPDASAIRLSHMILPLAKGTRYRLVGEGRSTTPRTVEVALGAEGEASGLGAAVANFSLTEAWTPISAEFTAESDTKKLVFNLGLGEPGEVELRRIAVQPAE